MKIIKQVTAALSAACIILCLLSGCTASAEGKAFYDAMLKAQSIKSSQNDIKYTFRFDATDLSESDTAAINQIKAMLNNMEMAMNMKQVTNTDNTVLKMQSDVNIQMGGMSMNMGVWADMDLNGTNPKFIEIIKYPTMITAANPYMAGKEYMVMDLGKTMDSSVGYGREPEGYNADKIKLIKEMQDKTNAFLAEYLVQYDPGFKLITDLGTRDILTPEGTVNARIYQIKLDDKSAKKLIRYTVNNFAENKAAMEYAADYLNFMGKFIASTPGAIDPADGMGKLMESFDKDEPELIKKFDGIMDKLEDIQLIGDKGIILEYAMDENGYIINQYGSMDFIFDISKLSELKEMNGSSSEKTGIINFGIDFTVLQYNINKDIDIEMPVITPENSFDINEIAAMGAQTSKAPEAIPTALKVLINGKPVSFDSYTIEGYNYFKIRDIAKAVSGTQKQFDVIWDDENKTINLVSQKAYTVIGGEMIPGDGKKKMPVLNTLILYKDGKEIFLNAYMIDGNNYFKLRDIAQAFNIGIAWDGENSAIVIDTTKDYTDR